MKPAHVLVGFGFGPIQAGLFVKEAYESGAFRRIAVAEINPELVRAVRENNGCYSVNVAYLDRIEAHEIRGVELLNPLVSEDREQLLEALAEATEIVTALPSINFYDSGGRRQSVASMVADGLKRNASGKTIIYTAENHNHAAEIFADAVARYGGPSGGERVQYLNTVIGKMSRVVEEASEIERLHLRPIAPGITRAFLVESFNRILVTRVSISDFMPGIRVFEEKDDLLPFEEVKLYGHNAIHVLLGFLADFRGYRRMCELRDDSRIMTIGRNAFLDESGNALIRRYACVGDSLFTPEGFRIYAEDLLERMTNPYLSDTIERICRDPIRKLGYNDRLFGAMRLTMEYGITPVNLALGACAGVIFLLKQSERYSIPESLRVKFPAEAEQIDVDGILSWIWGRAASQRINNDAVVQLVKQQMSRLLRENF
jgi:mannitol-1-phosphate 5-dehydrogenase